MTKKIEPDHRGNNRYYCPKCKAIHHWQAKKCHNPKCGFIGNLIFKK